MTVETAESFPHLEPSWLDSTAETHKHVAERYVARGAEVYAEVAAALDTVIDVTALVTDLRQGIATPTSAAKFPELYIENGGGIAVSDLTVVDSDPSEPVRKYIKHDTQQEVGAFKVRGAFVRCRKALEDNPQLRYLAASSAGNHGLGVAAFVEWHNRQVDDPSRQLEAHIFCRQGASEEKIAGMKRLGATVHQTAEGTGLQSLEAAAEAARVFVDDLDDGELAAAELVSPFDDAVVMAGQATQIMEILVQLAADGVDLRAQPLVLRVAGGGFGMAGGNAVLMDCLVRADVLHPDSRVVATQQQGGDSMVRAVEAIDTGQEVPRDLFENPYTGRDLFDGSNDGTGVRTPGKLNLPLTYYLRHTGRLVVESAPKWAVSDVIWDAKKLGYTLEPAGALPEAGQKMDRFNRAPRVEVCIRSGRNMSAATEADFLADRMRDAAALSYCAELASWATRSAVLADAENDVDSAIHRVSRSRTLRVLGGPTTRKFVTVDR